MGKSKYEGGARVTTFRLPKLWFDVAKSGVLKYLERYEIQPPILDSEAKVIITDTESAGFGVTKPKQRLEVKKTVPKDLVDKLKELDPNIIIPDYSKKQKL